VELPLQVPEARVDVAKFLVTFPKVHRDMPLQRESASELPRAVPAREAAPATAELLGTGLLSYCSILLRRRRLQSLGNRKHVVVLCSKSS
jgi:hypothetical protein